MIKSNPQDWSSSVTPQDETHTFPLSRRARQEGQLRPAPEPPPRPAGRGAVTAGATPKGRPVPGLGSVGIGGRVQGFLSSKPNTWPRNRSRSSELTEVTGTCWARLALGRPGPQTPFQRHGNAGPCLPWPARQTCRRARSAASPAPAPCTATPGP